jgi:hypothetical protein
VGKRKKGNYSKVRVLGQEEINRLDKIKAVKEEAKRLENLKKA